ncbi:hypothetical protein D1872_214790 [compost metagenome]
MVPLRSCRQFFHRLLQPGPALISPARIFRLDRKVPPALQIGHDQLVMNRIMHPRIKQRRIQNDAIEIHFAFIQRISDMQTAARNQDNLFRPGFIWTAVDMKNGAASPHQNDLHVLMPM